MVARALSNRQRPPRREVRRRGLREAYHSGTSMAQKPRLTRDD